ncbi:glycosyltransferase family 4 protein [bacterium]|nr:glycosyltransferase family 4 protein [bacterium]
MKVVFIRSRMEGTVCLQEPRNGQILDAPALERMRISQKAGSSTKNIIMGLMQYNVVSSSEEWKFWGGGFQEIRLDGQMPVKLFYSDPNFRLNALADYLNSNGQPDILWVEGTDYPPYLEKIFQLCSKSYKIVYSKDWRPHKVERLDEYDLCLVDEDWEVAEVKKRYPNLHCAVWDKLIDYQDSFRPLSYEKTYDICYIAYLRARKKHEVLFQAMAKVKDRKLNCICVGEDRKDRQIDLEKLVADLNISVHFAGGVSQREVNKYMSASRIGVLCARLDAAPRVVLEYMASDIPVLVNSELLAGTRYVGAGAGLVRSPAEFHQGICEILDNYERYSPREYFLQHYSSEIIIRKFARILEQSGCLQNNRLENNLGRR